MEGATDGTIVSGQSGAGATAQATATDADLVAQSSTTRADLVAQSSATDADLIGPSSATDADLIAESLSEAGRFATIYDRHAGTLFRFLVRRVGRDTADELLGETFRIAFERRATFDVERSSARPWLYGIATNLVAKHRRSEMRRLRATARLAGESGSFPEAAEAVAASVDAENAWSGVVAAIAALPDGERDAILLFVWEELSYEEIGAALGVPVGTVRSRLNRARRRLRELVPTEGKEAVNQPRNQSFSQRTRMGS